MVSSSQLLCHFHSPLYITPTPSSPPFFLKLLKKLGVCLYMICDEMIIYFAIALNPYLALPIKTHTHIDIYIKSSITTMVKYA